MVSELVPVKEKLGQNDISAAIGLVVGSVVGAFTLDNSTAV